MPCMFTSLFEICLCRCMLQLPVVALLISPPFAASAVDLPLSPFFASARPAVTSMAPSFKYMLCPPTSPLFYLTSILWLRCAPPLHMLHLAHTQTACTLDDPAFLLLASAGSSFFIFSLNCQKKSSSSSSGGSSSTSGRRSNKDQTSTTCRVRLENGSRSGMAEG